MGSKNGHVLTMLRDASHQQQQEEQADALQRQEGVWHLLLGELWGSLDQAIVSKLLCCSQAMADLIHTKCTGELYTSMMPVQSATVWLLLHCCSCVVTHHSRTAAFWAQSLVP
jgi:hypothetical protein